MSISTEPVTSIGVEELTTPYVVELSQRWEWGLRANGL
jgi:hypothetical protein